VQNLYDDEFYRNMETSYLSHSAWSRLRLKQVKRMVDPKPGDRILDMGCGMGSITHFCSTLGAEVTGIDASPLAIEKAKNLFKDLSAQFLVCDVSDLGGFMDGSFDKAVAADLVEHLPDDVFAGMLREVRRVLKAQGTLSIYTPCPSHIIERLKKRNLFIPPNPTHTDLRKMGEIQRMMEKNGFEINLAYYTTGFIPVMNWIEYLMKPLPVIGDFFRYRICIRGLKHS